VNSDDEDEDIFEDIFISKDPTIKHITSKKGKTRSGLKVSDDSNCKGASTLRAEVIRGRVVVRGVVPPTKSGSVQNVIKEDHNSSREDEYVQEISKRRSLSQFKYKARHDSTRLAKRERSASIDCDVTSETSALERVDNSPHLADEETFCDIFESPSHPPLERDFSAIDSIPSRNLCELSGIRIDADVSKLLSVDKEDQAVKTDDVIVLGRCCSGPVLRNDVVRAFSAMDKLQRFAFAPSERVEKSNESLPDNISTAVSTSLPTREISTPNAPINNQAKVRALVSTSLSESITSNSVVAAFSKKFTSQEEEDSGCFDASDTFLSSGPRDVQRNHPDTSLDSSSVFRNKVSTQNVGFSNDVNVTTSSRLQRMCQQLTPADFSAKTSRLAPGHMALLHLPPAHPAQGHLATGHLAPAHLAPGHPALLHLPPAHMAPGHLAPGGHPAGGHPTSGGHLTPMENIVHQGTLTERGQCRQVSETSVSFVKSNESVTSGRKRSLEQRVDLCPYYGGSSQRSVFSSSQSEDKLSDADLELDDWWPGVSDKKCKKEGGGGGNLMMCLTKLKS